VAANTKSSALSKKSKNKKNSKKLKVEIDTSEMLTINAAAQVLNISPSFISKNIELFPHSVVVGKSRWYDPKDVKTINESGILQRRGMNRLRQSGHVSEGIESVDLTVTLKANTFNILSTVLKGSAMTVEKFVETVAEERAQAMIAEIHQVALKAAG